MSVPRIQGSLHSHLTHIRLRLSRLLTSRPLLKIHFPSVCLAVALTLPMASQGINMYQWATWLLIGLALGWSRLVEVPGRGASQLPTRGQGNSTEGRQSHTQTQSPDSRCMSAHRTARYLSLVFHSRKPLPYLLPVFYIAAVPASIIIDTSFTWHTVTIAALLLPMVGFYVARARPQVFVWLCAIAYVHGAMMVFQFVTTGERATGFTNSPNVAAGFLVLCIVYLVSCKAWRLALPLSIPVFLAGGRAELVVLTAMLLVFAVQRHIPWRVLAVMAGSVALVALSGWGPANISFSPSETWADLLQRFPENHVVTLWPYGYDEGPPPTYPVVHNVAYRMASEAGLLAALLYLGLTGTALWRGRSCWLRRRLYTPPADLPGRPRRTLSAPSESSTSTPSAQPVCFLLLAWCLLGLLDNYPWAIMGGWWWLLLGIHGRDRSTSKGLGTS